MYTILLYSTQTKVVIETQSVGVQVGGIFLEPQSISLPTSTTTTGTQYNDDEESTLKKTERQQEHETQIQKLKSSLQLAYKVKHKVILKFIYLLV